MAPKYYKCNCRLENDGPYDVLIIESPETKKMRKLNFNNPDISDLDEKSQARVSSVHYMMRAAMEKMSTDHFVLELDRIELGIIAKIGVPYEGNAIQ
jgi:hypothetical protein